MSSLEYTSQDDTQPNTTLTAYLSAGDDAFIEKGQKILSYNNCIHTYNNLFLDLILCKKNKLNL